MWDTLLQAWPVVSDVFSGVMGAFGQQSTNEENRAASQAQMDFQERMSSTAHQREVKDLIAAGLNPILSANRGASSPAGSTYIAQNPYMAGMSASMGSSQAGLNRAHSALANRQAETEEAETEIRQVAAQQAKWVNANFERLLRARIMSAENEAGIGEVGSLGHSKVEAAKAEIVHLFKSGRLLDQEVAQRAVETVLLKHEIPKAKAFSEYFSSVVGQASPYVKDSSEVVSNAFKLSPASRTYYRGRR